MRLAVAVDRVDAGDADHRRTGPASDVSSRVPADGPLPGSPGTLASPSPDSLSRAFADGPSVRPADRAAAGAGNGNGRGDGAAEAERKAIAGRLYRVLADHVYGVARDAWAQALPELRAAWENHKQRYPERMRLTPRTTPDGSWEAGPRRLSPEQNAEASKACADIADEGRRDILPALKRVEAAIPDRHLAGLEHMLKGEDRLKEKIADELAAKPRRTVRQALDTVVDPVRFTFTYSPQRYANGIGEDVDRLKSEGFELVKLKNLWADEQYKGINSQWRRPETGLRFEVQFHTQESLEAKELTHGAYGRLRSSTSSPVEQAELEAFQRQVSTYLATPERTADIKDFPEKKHG